MKFIPVEPCVFPRTFHTILLRFRIIYRRTRQDDLSDIQMALKNSRGSILCSCWLHGDKNAK